MFRQWSSDLPAVEICAVQLPGREGRWSEPAFTRFPALAQALSVELRPLMDVSFAFLGHSMGALIAFELARQVRRDHGLSPVHLFVSGARAPHLPNPDPHVHQLADAELLAKLTKLNGIPAEISQNAELMQLLIPTLRADVTLCDTYVYLEEAALDCPISAYGGDCDRNVTAEQVAAWGAHTGAQFRWQMFPGDHFFLEGRRNSVLKMVSAALGVTGNPLECFPR